MLIARLISYKSEEELMFNNIFRLQTHYLPCYACISESIYFFICFIYSPGIHRERRKFLRSALKELALIFTDQPGLLGPKVGGRGGLGDRLFLV